MMEHITQKILLSEDVERSQQSRQRRRFSESLHVVTDNCLKPLPENRLLLLIQEYKLIWMKTNFLKK